MDEQYDLASDVIWGAAAIGRTLGMTRRQVYHACDQQYLPFFKVGSTVVCRRSTIMAYITAREEKNASIKRGL
ncbi:DNA-binding protein [Devosia sp. ZW T5_3]|uniref:DNA-binding protein n=1 Tax=Devosia sp. ZW T5_3 TaxID=3378085 RepID=UPI003854F272